MEVNFVADLNGAMLPVKVRSGGCKSVIVYELSLEPQAVALNPKPRT